MLTAQIEDAVPSVTMRHPHIGPECAVGGAHPRQARDQFFAIFGVDPLDEVLGADATLHIQSKQSFEIGPGFDDIGVKIERPVAEACKSLGTGETGFAFA